MGRARTERRARERAPEAPAVVIPEVLRLVAVQGQRQTIYADGEYWRHDGDCNWRPQRAEAT